MADDPRREEAIQKFPRLPPTLAFDFRCLLDDLHLVQVLWNQYVGLFRDDSAVATLNDTAPGFFGLIQRVLVESVVVGIGRLLDRATTRIQSNLTLEHVVDGIETIGPGFGAALRDERMSLCTRCASLIKKRHKVYAHRDYEHAVGIAEALPVTKKDIEDALTGLYRIVSRIHVEFSVEGSSIGPCGDPPGNYGNLLHDLEVLVFVQQGDPLWVPKMRHEMMLARAARSAADAQAG